MSNRRKRPTQKTRAHHSASYVRGEFEDFAGRKTGLVNGLRILAPGEEQPRPNRAGRRALRRKS